MRKIRIAFFTDILTANTDGVSRTLFNIIERIPENEFEFLFITPRPMKEIENLNWPVLFCPAMNFPLYPEYQLAFPFLSKRLNQKLDQFNPDVIHFTTPSLLGFFATRYGLRVNKPVVNIYHTHFSAYLEYYFPKVALKPLTVLMKCLIKAIYKPCDITFAPSSSIQKFLIQQGLPETSLKLLGRGVSLDKFSPQYRGVKHDIQVLSGSKIKLLFVGRLVFEKEIETLVRLYRRLEDLRLEIQLIIVGDGPKKAYLEKRMPNAYFSGKLIGEELSIFYACSDLFIFPSTTETFGNVVLEALASGLPVIAANEGGPVDIIQDGVNGFLVTPRDENEFLDKILFFKENPTVLGEFRERALASSHSRTWEGICQSLFDTYRQLSL